MKFDEIEIRRDVNDEFYALHLSDGIDRVKGSSYSHVWGYRNHGFYPKRWGKKKGLEFLKSEIKKKILQEIKERQSFLKEIEKVELCY